MATTAVNDWEQGLVDSLANALHYKGPSWVVQKLADLSRERAAAEKERDPDSTQAGVYERDALRLETCLSAAVPGDKGFVEMVYEKLTHDERLEKAAKATEQVRQDVIFDHDYDGLDLFAEQELLVGISFLEVAERSFTKALYHQRRALAESPHRL